MGTETDAMAPASALRRGLLRASLVHATETELDWLIAEAGTVDGSRRQQLWGMTLPIMGVQVLYSGGVAWRWEGPLVALLVLVGYTGFVVAIDRAWARRIDPAVHQRTLRTMKRKPSPDDPILPAGAPKRRRSVLMARGLIVFPVATIPLNLALQRMIDERSHAQQGVHEIQVGNVRCLQDESSHLVIRSAITNNTNDPYVVTMRADVATTADKF